MRIKDIAERFNVSTSWVSLHATRLQLQPRQKSSSLIPWRRVVELYVHHNWTATQIARSYQSTRGTIARGLQARGIAIRPGGPVWIDRTTECLTLRSRGMTFIEIGKALGITKWQVSYQLRKALRRSPTRPTA